MTDVAHLQGRYTCVLTLYALYRLRDDPACGPETKKLLTSLIGQLEARVFPDCFAPDIEKTVRSARTIIAEHDRSRAAPMPKPRRRDGERPCGECHVRTGETCDICGARG